LEPLDCFFFVNSLIFYDRHLKKEEEFFVNFLLGLVQYAKLAVSQILSICNCHWAAGGHTLWCQLNWQSKV